SGPSSPTKAQPLRAKPPLAKAGICASVLIRVLRFKTFAALLNAFAIPLFQTLSKTQLIGSRKKLATPRHALPIPSLIVSTWVKRLSSPFLNGVKTLSLIQSHGFLNAFLSPSH